VNSRFWIRLFVIERKYRGPDSGAVDSNVEFPERVLGTYVQSQKTGAGLEAE